MRLQARGIELSDLSCQIRQKISWRDSRHLRRDRHRWKVERPCSRVGHVRRLGMRVAHPIERSCGFVPIAWRLITLNKLLNSFEPTCLEPFAFEFVDKAQSPEGMRADSTA